MLSHVATSPARRVAVPGSIRPGSVMQPAECVFWSENKSARQNERIWIETYNFHDSWHSKCEATFTTQDYRMHKDAQKGTYHSDSERRQELEG